MDDYFIQNTPVCIVIIHVHSQFLDNKNVDSKPQMDDYFVQNTPVCIVIMHVNFALFYLNNG